MEKIIVGVDYSISSPSITILSPVTGKTVISFSSVKKNVGSYQVGDVKWIVHAYPKWESYQERYSKLVRVFADALLAEPFKEHGIDVYIEDYALGAKGQVFHIAEATQEFKGFCYRELGVIPKPIGIGQLKKLATKNGAAKKWLMREKLREREGIDFHAAIGQELRDDASPSSDAVDSYWCALVGPDFKG